ncbi:hypothetical protein GIB67_031146 [Kingdonia uniflora]|uniref:Uncharacterized protein n=1 Tax=Kingdonia uniflora TaxID=39325 RepID=A0A7J7LD02_9MAGN|nr:hypothetical protein GIB67_031146 [Kingdonia uniflora]
MLTSLSIGRYPTQVPYEDAWRALSNVRQLLPNIDSNYIKSGNVSIAHLRMYLTIAIDRDDDTTIARTFILFMMGHLWFQTANDTVLLGYLTAVANLNSIAQYDWYWFYEYCGVGNPIVKEDVKFLAYLRLRAWERGNKKKTNDQATNLLILGIYHIDYCTIDTITWEPWLESAMSEIEDVLTAKLLSPGITSVVVTSASVHSLSHDFSLPSEVEGTDPGWYMEWTGRREMLLIACLMEPPPMSSSYGAKELWHLTHGMWRLVLTESARDAQRLKELTDEFAIAH